MFSQRLKELRQSRNLSQSELAGELQISNRTISMYEQGNSEPSISILVKIAEYFNVTTDYLVGMANNSSAKNQCIYDNIGLSDDSISFLKSLVAFEHEYRNSHILQLSPLKCIDFCLSQGELSHELFDSIHSYFLARITGSQGVYILPDGKITLKPEENAIAQKIPAIFLPEAILQEVSINLKILKQKYNDNFYREIAETVSAKLEQQKTSLDTP
jgi:transcriptional regulator with XRE-family HTH domain